MQFAKNILKKFISPPARHRLRALQAKICLPLYAGSRYHCPCCQSNFGKFLSFYGKENIRCPRCNSLERHRLEWLYLRDVLNLFRQKIKILHFAPEKSLHERFQKIDNWDYITADSMASFIPGICVRPDYLVDITDSKFGDDSFDFVLCNHVLEHVPNDEKAMMEILRVLKPGGRAILQVPIDKSREQTLEEESIVSADEKAKYYGSPDHVRLYGRDYREKLEKAGFSVKVDNYIETFDAESIDKYRMDANEDIYLMQKMNYSS